MYPMSEVRAAYLTARDDGGDPPPVDDSTAVAWLERRGYLPRDRERVDRVVALATAAARAGRGRDRPDIPARRARSARHHRMRPHRAIVVRSA